MHSELRAYRSCRTPAQMRPARRLTSPFSRACPQRYRWHLEKNVTQMAAVSWRLTKRSTAGWYLRKCTTPSVCERATMASGVASNGGVHGTTKSFAVLLADIIAPAPQRRLLIPVDTVHDIDCLPDGSLPEWLPPSRQSLCRLGIQSSCSQQRSTVRVTANSHSPSRPLLHSR